MFQFIIFLKSLFIFYVATIRGDQQTYSLLWNYRLCEVGSCK